jgi:hypothetical protein
VRIRDVSEELEAKLSPVVAGAGAAARGKAEWKVYRDGSQRAKLRASGLGLADGVAVDLVLNGRLIGRAEVLRGALHFRRESERGDLVPAAHAGESVQIVVEQRVILEGIFRPE